MLNVRVSGLGELQPVVAGVVLTLQRLHEHTLELLSVIVVGFASGLAAPLAGLRVFILEMPMATTLVNTVPIFGLSFSSLLALNHCVLLFIFAFPCRLSSLASYQCPSGAHPSCRSRGRSP